jgi:hypothetical protein
LEQFKFNFTFLFMNALYNCLTLKLVRYIDKNKVVLKSLLIYVIIFFVPYEVILHLKLLH